MNQKYSAEKKCSLMLWAAVVELVKTKKHHCFLATVHTVLFKIRKTDTHDVAGYGLFQSPLSITADWCCLSTPIGQVDLHVDVTVSVPTFLSF